MARIAILGVNTATTATASRSITVGTPVPAGSLVVVAAAFENAAAAIPVFTSLADSRGNTYSADWDSAAGAGNGTAAVGIASGVIATPLQAGDSITLTISATRIRWAIEGDAFDDPAGTSPLDKAAANHNPGSDSTLLTGTTAAALSQPRELLIAAFGGGVRTYSPGAGGWAGGPSVDTDAGSADRSLFLEYKYVETPAPTTQSGTATVNSSTTYCGCLATYRSWRANPRPAGSRQAAVRAARW